MAVRPVDAEKYMELLKEQYLHHEAMGNKQVAKAWQGAMQLLYDMPTLTPSNEWVEALEAINNAAVAYIEGGPYENDLPGMELAVEIDRLSRDFVRPPNEPLTIEELREMDGRPAYWPDDESWGIVSVDDSGRWAGIPFFRGRKNGVNFEYDIVSRGMEVYAYPPAHIDREKWTAEWVDNDQGEEMMCKCFKCGYPVSYFWGKTAFCPGCGRAMTPEALAELERRVCGG